MSSWTKKADGTLSLAVTVPANVSATVYVPATDAGKVMESGKSAAKSSGVAFVRQEKGAAVYTVGSGTYTFSVKP
ncbi:MAG: hypothetical protein EOP06_27220 [Proteobacteria bacterium]|nr:MAG: hypothetical protein EOP06_27220 [Pseudomonadota bacterium]